MRPIQQDDIQDSFNQPKKEFRWIHEPSRKIVRAINKKKAVQKFKEVYNLSTLKADVRQAQIIE